MFQIVVSGIQQSYQEIEQQISKRNVWITQIKEIEKKLSNFSNMEDLIDCLNKQLRQLEIEQQQYIQLLQALNLVLTYYEECEKRIISKSELGNHWAFQVAIKNNDFSHIANELKSIQLE